MTRARGGYGRGRERGAVGKVHKRPSVPDQFVEYLRDHLLLDRRVDVNPKYDGKSSGVCLDPGKADWMKE